MKKLEILGNAKFKVMYRFAFSDGTKGPWHDDLVYDDMLSAKRGVKDLKRHLGRCGSVKIIRIEG